MPKTIDELKHLMCIPTDAEDEYIKDVFERIANILKNNCVIQYEDKEYRILDFEFYFYNKNHRDISVHPRKSEALHWYINDFGGIDLNFKSDIEKVVVGNNKKWSYKYELTDNSFFGGILIRQIQEICGEKRVFDGPLKVAELFRMQDATSQHQNNPILAMKSLEPLDFVSGERLNLLGKHTTAKEKADYNLKSCFKEESYINRQTALEEEFGKFVERKYRFYAKTS